MKLQLLPSMDPQSLDIMLDEKFVGYFQWHNGPSLIFWETGIRIPVAVIEDIIRQGNLRMRA